MISTLTVALFAVAAAVLAVAMYFLGRIRRPAPSPDPLMRLVGDFQRELTQLRAAVHQQMLDLSRQMSEQFKQNSQFLQQTHHDYSDAMGQVHHRLGQLQQATQSMEAIGKDIASLQDILRAPKLRGGIGELILAELLRQILPEDHFALQYTFRTGTRVDAVILLGEAMIPVDAKFPLEDFKRILTSDSEEAALQARKSFHQCVRGHIDDIAEKYILPEEGTYDFALMYIPAENVYYETIIKDEMQTESLASYAMRRKVVPVSPNSFYAYLQAIVRGLKGLRIEQSAQRILESLSQLERDLEKVALDFEKVGAHLTNAQSSYVKTQRSFDRIRARLNVLEEKETKPLGVQAVPEESP